MDDKRRIRLSKFISKYLRHAPEKLGLTLEPGGWVVVDDLLAGAARAGVRLTRDELAEVVRDCEKQRFALDEAGTRIRANQGHSAEVDLELAPSEPPAELFHGTPAASLPLIPRDGLLKMARHHVHLSPDTATAVKVGSRRGKPVVLVINAARMRADGHVFFRSANGVWLAEHVPAQYLRLLTPED
jgi:putative RNA 2'-phosphotransferase